MSNLNHLTGGNSSELGYAPANAEYWDKLKRQQLLYRAMARVGLTLSLVAREDKENS